MPTSTEIFINAELPKRPYTNQFPFTSGHVPVATGVGLQVEARALTTSDISDMSSYATQEDLSNVLADANEYADGLVVGLWDDRGAYTVNAAGNINYPSTGGSGAAGALVKGDIFTVAGAVAGVSTINNIPVNNGDTVRALVDNPSATDNAHWAIAENNIGYVPENTANKTTNTDLNGATGTYPDTPTVKSYIDKYDISAASINSTGTVTLTRTASDLTFQVPTAISGLSFDANTGVLTSSYTNNATSTTITVAANEVSDNVFRIKDNDDATKKIAFQASNIAANQTRTITMPNVDVDLARVYRYVFLSGGTVEAQPGTNTIFRVFANISIVIEPIGVGNTWEFIPEDNLSITLNKGTNSFIFDTEGNAIANATESSTIIELKKNCAIRVTRMNNSWIVDYGANRRYAPSGKLGLVSTSGPGAGYTKYKTTFVRSSGSGFTSNVTVDIPDKNVNLGTISSVATTDGNTLSGTRTRILGGSSNTVSGTDVVAVGCNGCDLSMYTDNVIAIGLQGTTNSYAVAPRRAILLGSSALTTSIFNISGAHAAALGVIQCVYSDICQADGTTYNATLDGVNTPSSTNCIKLLPHPSALSSAVIDLDFIIVIGDSMSGALLAPRRTVFAKRRVYVVFAFNASDVGAFSSSVEVIGTDTSVGSAATGTVTVGVTVDSANNRLIPTVSATSGSKQTKFQFGVRSTAHYNRNV